MWFFDPTLFLFLLLPVAAFSGWVIGRRHDSSIDKHTRQEFPAEYLQGLNFFLNEQPDKAIDVVIQMLEVNKETVETHLALGSLFRRRGEVDRAIRIHQNLLTRPALNPNFRANAMFELGQDYMRAGLLDRAESVFAELIATFPKNNLGLTQLIDIYQQEHEWAKAIEIADKLPGKKNKTQKVMIAHFYCEMAEAAFKMQDSAAAQRYAKQALEIDVNCARANLILGNMLRNHSDYPRAIECYQRIEKQSPNVIIEALDAIVQCYTGLNKTDDLLVYLKGLLERHGYVAVMVKTADIVKSHSGVNAANEFIEGEIRKHPSLKGMEKLVDSHLEHVKSDVRDKLMIIKTVVSQMLKERHSYQCSHCGFGSRVLYWQCPGCREWSTIKPVQGM